MIIVQVELVGASAFLMHRFGENAEGALAAPMRSNSNVNRHTPRDEAVMVEYRDKENKLYIPGTWISRSFADASSYYKQKGSRKSLRFVAPAAFMVLDETIRVLDPETNKPQTTYEVDSRPVVIPSTKGRVMRHRPRIERWKLRFTVQIDERIIDPTDAQQILTEAGYRSGLGDFRVSRGGPFGRFSITGWQVAKRVDDAAKDSRAARELSTPSGNGS